MGMTSIQPKLSARMTMAAKTYGAVGIVGVMISQAPSATASPKAKKLT
jgi:hypothetical protein